MVDDDVVFMRTVAGRVKVDVIYRRVDDDFLDPLVFRPDSMLGVPGLIAAYAAGNVAILNAPGNGIADDKAIYSYMPEIVKFYSGGAPTLPMTSSMATGHATPAASSALSSAPQNRKSAALEPRKASGPSSFGRPKKGGCQ